MKQIKGLHVVVAVIRFCALQMLFFALLDLSYLPERLFYGSHAVNRNFAHGESIEIVMVIFRIAMTILVSVSLLTGAWPLARFLTRGDEADELRD